MSTLRKIKKAVRGEVKLTTAALEALRRTRVSLQDRFSSRNPDPLDLCSRIPPKPKFFLTGANLQFLHNEPIEYRRDPRSGYLWRLDYHRDIKVMRSDGSDIRVVWELNRLAHLIPLGRAYVLTKDERIAGAFVHQLRAWNEQNPYGRGPNWTCAMEVALRAINVLAAFHLFRESPQLDTQFLLHLFQQHGRFIRRNLEFSYVATSNHYLSDVAGLLWIGVMAPELRDAESWRAFGLKELLREMDKQVLPDGADFEASTGYHRFVTELFLYSFVLCRDNGIDIDKKYWTRLRAMLLYIRGYLRPDGLAPLIGDTDGGQFLPLEQRHANDHAYLLEIAAELLNDPALRERETESKAFPDAGLYIMRHDDLYLCFNASGTGVNGRGSHGHNDALSIDVCVGDCAFIVDPGTYVYTADLQKRHDFRSTAYHSTVKIDGEEQNTTHRDMPFVIGDEAKPRVLRWETDKIVAEHYGYRRLKDPVTHRRSVTFIKDHWLIDDEFFGNTDHEYEIRFHFAPHLKIDVQKSAVQACGNGARLLVSSLNGGEPVLESQAVSRDYGEMSESLTACWRFSGRPGKLSWKLSL